VATAKPRTVPDTGVCVAATGNYKIARRITVNDDDAGAGGLPLGMG